MSERSKREVIMLSVVTGCINTLNKKFSQPEVQEHLRGMLEHSVDLLIDWPHKGFTEKQRKEITNTISKWENDIQTLKSIYTINILTAMMFLICNDLFNSFEGSYKRRMLGGLFESCKKFRELIDPEGSQFEVLEISDTMIHDLYKRIGFEAS